MMKVCKKSFYNIDVLYIEKRHVSFQDEDDTFKVKKSSHSKRVAKQLKKIVLQEKGIDTEVKNEEKSPQLPVFTLPVLSNISVIKFHS